MADEISIEIRGAAEAERKIEQLALHISDLRPFWPLVVPMFIRWMAAQFASEGTWGGRSWSPLSPAYAKAKAAHFPGKTILIAEGDLRGAASRPGRAVTPRSLTLSITDPKAGFHQEGTSKMPARPIIPERLPDSARRDLEHAGEVYVGDLVHRLGLQRYSVVGISQKREQRASLVALLEQASGARVLIRSISDAETFVGFEGGTSRVRSLRARADVNETLALLVDLAEAGML